MTELTSFPDETETRVQRVKRHIRDHKETYVVGAIGLLVGAATAVLLMNKRSDDIDIEQGGSIVDSPHAMISNAVLMLEAPRRKGHPGYIIFDHGARVGYASLNECAKALHINRGELSKLAAGRPANLNGYDLEIMGDAAA